jgi:hypothetical protein
MKYLDQRPERASGELTVKGTRIRVAQVINMLANGFTLQELHTEHFPQRVFKNFVTREGFGVRSGYGTPKTLPNRPDRLRMGIA